MVLSFCRDSWIFWPNCPPIWRRILCTMQIWSVFSMFRQPDNQVPSSNIASWKSTFFKQDGTQIRLRNHRGGFRWFWFLKLEPNPYGRFRGGTSKSSILLGFSIINHPFWGCFPIFGNTHIPNIKKSGNKYISRFFPKKIRLLRVVCRPIFYHGFTMINIAFIYLFIVKILFDKHRQMRPKNFMCWPQLTSLPIFMPWWSSLDGEVGAPSSRFQVPLPDGMGDWEIPGTLKLRKPWQWMGWKMKFPFGMAIFQERIVSF